MTLVATCLFGLEKLLGEEIDALGCKRIETMDGRIFFSGDERDIVRANLRLRLAEHVFVPAKLRMVAENNGPDDGLSFTIAMPEVMARGVETYGTR